MSRALTSCMLAAGTLALLGVSAHAQESVKGCYSSLNNDRVMQLAEDHLYVVIDREGMGYITEDRNSVMFGAGGPCYGIVEMRGEELLQNTGYCVRTDPDGDQVRLDWTVEGFRDGLWGFGKWEIAGISGKWIDSSGGGTFEYRKGPSEELEINCFEGEIDVPRAAG